MTPTFQGEVQLRRWSESSTQGVQVTFALADADDLEPLKIKSGKRFMAVLVEIGDDEQPAHDPKLNPLLNREVGPLCKWLVMRCEEPEFWEWLGSQIINGKKCQASTAEHAKEAVCYILNITSRKEVDGNPEVESYFHEAIRRPYQHWLVRRQG